MRSFTWWKLGTPAAASAAQAGMDRAAWLARTIRGIPGTLRAGTAGRSIGGAQNIITPSIPRRETAYFQSPPKGAYPSGGVIRDSAGNLYGTTSSNTVHFGGADHRTLWSAAFGERWQAT